jgi:hypothetical protein
MQVCLQSITNSNNRHRSTPFLISGALPDSLQDDAEIKLACAVPGAPDEIPFPE